MRNYVIINGVNSLTIPGLAIKSLPPITKPIQRTLREEIDGRDGDIITELGYGAYDKEIEIGLFGNFDVDQVIAYFNQKGTITFSNEPDKVYYFQALNQVDYEELIKFREAGVTLHCQPFKYPVTEEPLIEEYEYVTGSGTNITLENTEETIFNEIELQGNTIQGGTPTPSSPIPVNVVSGDNEINVCGKNLFTLKNIINNTALGIERTINNSVMTLNGTSTGSGQIMSRQTTGIVLPSGTYTLSVKRGSGTITPNSKQMAFYFRKPSGTEIKSFLVNNFSNTAYSFSSSFTLTESTEIYVELYCNGVGYALDNLTLQFQIEKGSSVSDLEQYVGDKYDINLPTENLCNNDNVLGLFLNYTNLTIGEADGSKTMYAKVPKNTDLTVSRTTLTNRFRIGLLNEIPQNGGTFSLAYYDDSTQLLSKTINSGNYEYVAVQYTNQNEDANIQIEQGSKANTYTPFGTTPIELCSSQDGTKKDYFLHDKTLDKWYWHREIGKYIFGSTNLAYDSTYNRAYTNVSSIINNILIPTSNSEALNGLSNYFSILNATTFLGNTSLNGLAISSTGTLSLRNTSYTTQTDYNNWLSTNKPILYYALATPTNTEITYQPLIDQLNAIENATSYRGQTNISQTNNDAPFMMIVSVLQLGSDVITIPDGGNIYSKPTIKLEGTGIVEVYLNDIQEFEVDLTEDNEITIDTERMEAYTDTGLANRRVTGDYSKFKLQPGDNELRFSGALTKATITRYTRWL